MPIRPTKRIVPAPTPGSAPSQEDGLIKSPFPLVETNQTKQAEALDMEKINPAIINLTWYGSVFPVAQYLNNAGPKYSLVRVHLNNFSLESENKKAAGTAQETVGHPGIQMPIIAKTTKSEPRAE